MISDLKEFCGCCGKPVNKTNVPMSISRKEMGFLGPLFPLYFKYLLYCIFVCVMLFVFNLYALIANYNSSACSGSNYECGSGLVVKMSWINNLDQSLQSTLNMWSVILLLLANQLYFRSMRKSEDVIDSLHDTPSDYTLMISRLPPG